MKPYAMIFIMLFPSLAYTLEEEAMFCYPIAAHSYEFGESVISYPDNVITDNDTLKMKM